MWSRAAAKTVISSRAWPRLFLLPQQSYDRIHLRPEPGLLPPPRLRHSGRKPLRLRSRVCGSLRLRRERELFLP
jgi:hypothetical protein